MARVYFPTSDLLRQFRGLELAIERRRTELLTVLGTRLLSEAQKAFQQKSRGGRGSDGITWKKLAESTVARKTRRGRKNEKRRKTKGGKTRPPAGSTNIGVDTGLLRASAQPGFSGTATTADGQRRTASNVFIVNERSATVGYAREYAEYFDAVRPLLPDTLPVEWKDALDESAQNFLDRYVRGE